MPYAIEMFFDKNSDAYIRQIWRTLKENDISSFMHDSGNTPHISLAVFNKLDVSDADQKLHDFSARMPKFQIPLVNIGTFPTGEGVLFLSPVVTEELLHFHKALHDLFNDAKDDQWPFYLPGLWIPHCTLALNLTREKLHEAFDAVLSTHKPLGVEVDRIGLVEFHPVKVIKEYKLKE